MSRLTTEQARQIVRELAPKQYELRVQLKATTDIVRARLLRAEMWKNRASEDGLRAANRVLYGTRQAETGTSVKWMLL